MKRHRFLKTPRRRHILLRPKSRNLAVERLEPRTLLDGQGIVALSMDVVELDSVPGVLIGEQFDVEVRFADVREAGNPKAVFSGYGDINFDPAMIRVDDVTYDDDYDATNSRRGSVDNISGVIDELGAANGVTQPDDTLVATLRMTALAPGMTTITSDAGEDAFSETTVYGLDGDQRNDTIYASLTLDIQKPDTVALSLDLIDLEGDPGILVGEQFVVQANFSEIAQDRAVFSGYVDINFDSALVRVDEIVFDSDYDSGQTGTIGDGIVDEVGATDGTTPPADQEIFRLLLTALAEGTATIATDAGEDALSEIVVFGNDNDQRDATFFDRLDVSIDPGMIDSDGDSVPNIIEEGAGNGGDGNNDGTPDRAQAHVASLPHPDTGIYVTIAAPKGQDLSAVQIKASPDLMPPEDLDFRLGQLVYQVQAGASEETLVTIFAEGAMGLNTYYKYGSTPEISDPHFYRFLFDGQTGAELLEDRIVVHYRDGQRGDSDLTADGVISDPGAPVTNVSDFLHRNPVDRFDVNEDSRVSALDALNVINELFRSDGPRDLPPLDAFEFLPFFDANGDDRVSALDALVVINQLARINIQNEGEQLGTSQVTLSLNNIFKQIGSLAPRQETSDLRHGKHAKRAAPTITDLDNGTVAPLLETRPLSAGSEPGTQDDLQRCLDPAFAEKFFDKLESWSLEMNVKSQLDP